MRMKFLRMLSLNETKSCNADLGHARCQPAGLTCIDLILIGLLYKAYPDGCQQVS